MQHVQHVDLGLLTTLDALLQEESVTLAARRIGLSTPAVSHALARIREKLGDQILVRSGRGMVLTPRAEALKARVHMIVTEAQKAFEPERAFVPLELTRTFVVHVTDYVLTILGLDVDRILCAEAPGVCLRFVPNSMDDSAMLRDGSSDLAVGIYGELPPEMRSRQLLTDRFVCVVRQGHPTIEKSLSLEQFIQYPHIQVAPRGKPGGYVDDMLREKGLSRHVARAIPFFGTALQLAAHTDYILTISERIARAMAPTLNLAVLEVPIELRPYALSLLWHPRVDSDEGHRFLRDVFIRAARDAASHRHEKPLTRLDPSNPTSGQTRKRIKKKRSA